MLALLAAACGASSPGLVYASGNAALSMTFVVLSNNICSFMNPVISSLSLVINPLATVTQSSTGTLRIFCGGGAGTAVVSLSGPSSGVLTDTATASNTIAYSIGFPGSLSFPATNTQTVTVSAAISPTALAAAPAGLYTDSFSITIAP